MRFVLEEKEERLRIENLSLCKSSLKESNKGSWFAQESQWSEDLNAPIISTLAEPVTCGS